MKFGRTDSRVEFLLSVQEHPALYLSRKLVLPPISGRLGSTVAQLSADDSVRRIAEDPYALFCGEDRNGCRLEGLFRLAP